MDSPHLVKLRVMTLRHDMLEAAVHTCGQTRVHSASRERHTNMAPKLLGSCDHSGLLQGIPTLEKALQILETPYLSRGHNFSPQKKRIIH